MNENKKKRAKKDPLLVAGRKRPSFGRIRVTNRISIVYYQNANQSRGSPSASLRHTILPSLDRPIGSCPILKLNAVQTQHRNTHRDT